MVSLNYSTMGMTAKVVYYGPGLGGKTTNLKYIYENTTTTTRGEMVLMETETDRTLFFDLLPLEVGSVAGFKTRVQLYTVPGQVFYNDTRKLVLKGVDGVVFVADSQRPMMQANLDSIGNLQENLRGLGIPIDSIPLVLQYNKRDLDGALCSVDELNEKLNLHQRPFFEACALSGYGVFETLRSISRLTLRSLKEHLLGEQHSAPTVVGLDRRPEAPPATSSGGNGSSQFDRPAVAAHRVGDDALEALERIRLASLGDPGTTGKKPRRLRRDVDLTLRSAELHAARTIRLSLEMEDAAGETRQILRDLRMDLGSPVSGDQLLLQLNVALNAKD